MICSLCHIDQEDSAFSSYTVKSLNGQYYTYKRHSCKACERIRSKKYRATHPPKPKTLKEKLGIRSRWEFI